MPNPLVPPGSDCCLPDCEDIVGLRVPGPRGDPGTDGEDGTNGLNAYTELTAGFTMPAEGANEVVTVTGSDWMTPGQEVFVEFAGTFQVISKADSTHATIKNLEDTAAGTYANNAPPGTAIPDGARISPAGLQGPIGIIPANILDDGSPTTSKGDLLVDDGANNPNASLQRQAVGTNGTTLHADSTAGNGVAWAKTDLTSAAQVTGALPITNGGTGQASQTAGFNALSPLTTRGDLLTRDATNNIRLARGTSGFVVSNDGTDVTWVDPTTLFAMGVFVGADTGIVDQALDTFAHGLSHIPYLIQIYIRCTDVAGELGWALGDVLLPDQTSFTIAKDNTNIRVQVGHGAPINIDIRKGPTAGPTQGEVGSINNSKWDYFVVAN